MEISRNVHSFDVKIDWFPQPYPPNVHLVFDGKEGALIDSGFSDDESIKPRLEILNEYQSVVLKYIVITHHHFDHSSGAARLREATGAKIVMHKDEAPLLQRAAKEELPADVEVPADRKDWVERTKRFREDAAAGAPDRLVDDGEVLEVGSLRLRTIHSPGHTAGHNAPFLEAHGSEPSVLFAGDNVLGMGTTVVPPPPNGDMSQYIESLRKMKSLNADLMCCGHGPVVKEPNRKLQELIDHRHEREEQILSLAHGGKGTVKALVGAIYPELDKRLRGMAGAQVISHLSKLEREGRVRTEGEGEETKVDVIG
jgi:glyoxylase-like metal-dependent hydrolase (beta-lactamase superfamily II)